MNIPRHLPLLIVFQIFGLNCTRADSYKTHTVALAGNLGTAVAQYKLRFHKLPKSWEEVKDAEVVAPEFWGYVRTDLNFETRYRFLDPTVSVLVTGQSEKIVVMAIEPGLEGNLGEGRDEPGRRLIVEMPSGDIQTRNYSEALLAKLFERAGSDLKDYTTSKGKWFEVEATPEMDAALSARASSKKLVAERRHKQREIAYSNRRAERRKPVLWGVAAGSVLVFAMLVVIWKRLQKRSQMERK
jgi:hypothetical protein